MLSFESRCFQMSENQQLAKFLPTKAFSYRFLSTIMRFDLKTDTFSCVCGHFPTPKQSKVPSAFSKDSAYILLGTNEHGND